MKIIGLGGLSECGKSYSGSYISEKYSIPRVKIVAYFTQYVAEYFNNEISLEAFHQCLYTKPNQFTNFFLNKIAEDLKNDYKEYPFIVIESLRNDYFGTYLKAYLQNEFVVIYLETEFEHRVKREAIKTGQTVKDTLQHVYSKDVVKISQGALEYKKIADYIIDNNHSVEQLNIELDKIVAATLKEG